MSDGTIIRIQSDTKRSVAPSAPWITHGRILLTLARMTFRENILNRLPWAVMTALGVGMGLALFVDAVSITENEWIQGAIAGAFYRLMAVFLLTATVIVGVAREFDDRMVALTLALPIPRSVYFAGKLLGFAMTATPMAAIFGLGLLPFAPSDQVLLWSLSLGCELLLMAALGFLLVLSLTHITPALTAAMATYLLARTINTMVLIASGPLANLTPMPGKLILPTLRFLSWLVPDLGRFTSGEWLAYHTGRWSDLATIALETLVTLFFLCGAGLFDLYRKNL
ncbi:MAG: ABC transporter permease [Magnetococcales bacterium]|nr:ABC transporter permease [Magnetococcales bacterium]